MESTGVRHLSLPFKLSALQVILILVLTVAAIVVVFPFVWMVFTSFKYESDVFSWPPRLVPTQWTTDAYRNIWSQIPFELFFRNSLIFAGGVTLISLFLDSLAAYSFSRFDYPGRDAFFILVLIALMLPFQVTFIPLYITVQKLGLLNTFGGLIIPRATNAFGIFMLRQFFSGIPRELDDAARIDGASEFYIYARIIMPLSGPALATLGIFHFMYNWNDFLWPMLITKTTEMRTLPAGLALFMGEHVIDNALLMAGATLALLPLFIAFLFAQKYFVQSIVMTGLKE
ncbi:MAG TPA: carbohydrate ABC transporter permease [Aggregatilinea sp.]|jgi:multiple sugar transport system permease protein|uniref:carbohydrate ABC transporter permease n=1 Tax=Aggregatilinea sp. TaxID=2806333 RepID=UPI002B5CAD3F|nr:carbohydrate ABC transporter permease [Aggregatilinea sp.]HML20226.1 carbohydrate ABC transporter permease [Aggregatilinea sp.]